MRAVLAVWLPWQSNQQNGELWQLENEQATCQQMQWWQNWVYLFCSVVLLICPYSEKSRPSAAKDVANLWGALVTPSCTRPPFFGDLMLFISALIVSGFGYLTFLLHGQVYLRHAYLHAHDYGSVWITAERRLVLTWGGRQGGNSLIDKSLWDAVSERWPYFTVKSFEGWILWVNAIVT